MEKSTHEEVLAARELVEATETRVRELLADGKKVHFIWDVDHCLVSGRSNDVFDLIGHDVQKFHRYEERQFLQILGNGLWTRFATKVGWLYDSHDIVTARGALPALRVIAFVIARKIMPVREMLFVGSQPKTESYRCLLSDFADKPEWHIFLVDDTADHIVAFDKVASELGMTDRTASILSPRIRRYTKQELTAHYLEVMNPHAKRPYLATTGSDDGRTFLVTPDPVRRILEMFKEERAEMRAEMRDAKKRGPDALVEANRRAQDELRSLLGPPERTGFFDRLPTDEEFHRMVEYLPALPDHGHPDVDAPEPDGEVDPFTENARAWVEAERRGEEIPWAYRKFFDCAGIPFLTAEEIDEWLSDFDARVIALSQDRTGDWYETADWSDDSED